MSSLSIIGWLFGGIGALFVAWLAIMWLLHRRTYL